MRDFKEVGTQAAETASAPEHDPIAKDDLDMPSSKRTTAPAFQFYPKEFLSSTKVIAMTATERGVYITLLSMQWLDGSLPDDMPALARLVGVNVKAFTRLWPHNLARCFVLKNGRLVNPRLEAIRMEQAAYRKRQAEYGTKGGRPPEKGKPSKQKRVAFNSNKGTETPSISDLQSAISDLQSVDIPNARETRLTVASTPSDPPMDVWFRELVGAYPPSAVSSGHLTEQAFFAAVVSQGSPAVTFTVMLGNLENQKRGHQWRVKGMVPRLDRWLKDGLWKQVHEADPPAAEQVSARTMRMLGSV